MNVLSHGADASRRIAGGIVEATLLLSIVGALAMGAAVVTGVGPAGADAAMAKGNPHAAAPASSIKLDQEGQALAFGSKVTFTTVTVGLTGGEYPMVYVECLQGAAVVYGQLDHPDAVFVLGGGSSAWWATKGAASCDAKLYAYGGKTKGGYDTIRLLAGPVPFEAV